MVLHRLSLVCGLWIIVFFLKLNCSSKGFSCNFLDLAVQQIPQGIPCDIFDKHSQPEYPSIEIIYRSQFHCNISITAHLGVVNSQFYRFLRHCSYEEFFVSQMVSLIVLMKNKDYPLKILLKRIRGLLDKKKILFGISTIGVFWTILVSGLVSQLGLCSSLLSFSLCFVYLVVFFCSYFLVLFVASQ